MHNNEIVKRYMGWCPNTFAMRTASTILTTLPVTLQTLEPEGGGGRSGRIDRGIKTAARGEIIVCFLLFGLVLAGVSLTSLLFRVVYGLVAPHTLLSWYPGGAWIAGAALSMPVGYILKVIISSVGDYRSSASIPMQSPAEYPSCMKKKQEVKVPA